MGWLDWLRVARDAGIFGVCSYFLFDELKSKFKVRRAAKREKRPR